MNDQPKPDQDILPDPSDYDQTIPRLIEQKKRFHDTEIDLFDSLLRQDSENNSYN